MYGGKRKNMNLTNYYWYFQSAVPSRICDEIVKYSKSIQDQLATTGGYGDPKKLNQKQIKDLKKKRNSDIVWMNDRWIYNEIQPYIHTANKSAGWNFEWDFTEHVQYTEYKKGQFYRWVLAYSPLVVAGPVRLLYDHLVLLSLLIFHDIHFDNLLIIDTLFQNTKQL